MVKICAVKNCTSRRSNKTLVKDVSSLSFFLAKSQTKLEEWSRALCMRLKPTDFVCQLHFKEEDLQISYKHDNSNIDQYCNFKKKLLKKNAMPTIEHQLHRNLEIEEEQQTKYRKRRKIREEDSEGLLKVQQLISNLKENYATLPENWLFVEKSNEIGFMRVDPITMKIKNHIVINADFTVTAIGSNNRKVFLTDQISSPNVIYDYLKYVEKWVQCVGTLLDGQGYAKNCKGVITDDDSCKRNQFYPRCNPCRLLRQVLLYGRKPFSKKGVDGYAVQDNENLIQCEHTKTMDKTIVTHEYKAEIDSDYSDQPEIIRESHDELELNKNDRLKQKLRDVWSSPKFCGLCLESNGSFHPIDTELIINRQKFSKCLHDIINYIFHEDIKHFMSSSYVCERCTEKTIQTYIFIHNTKEMSKIMENCVSDVYSKVIDLNEQISPTVDYDDANVMIVLENNKDLYKNILDTRINEVIHITKPIHMKIDKKVANSCQNDTNNAEEGDIVTAHTEVMQYYNVNDVLKEEIMDIDKDITKIIPSLTSETVNEEPEIKKKAPHKIDLKLINLIPMAPSISINQINSNLSQIPTGVPVRVIKGVPRNDITNISQVTPVASQIKSHLSQLVLDGDHVVIKRLISPNISDPVQNPSTFRVTNENNVHVITRMQEK